MRTPANDLSSRRQVLASLAGAALPFAARATPRRVAVVGAGMAGIGCAWLLDASHDVVVFESRADIGGHVRTLAIDSGGQSWPVDVGAQYFHPVPYPGYTQLLAELGLYPAGTGGSHAFPVTITVDQAGGARPAYVSPQLPGRAWALLADWNQAGTTAFATALRAARRREQADASWARRSARRSAAIGFWVLCASIMSIYLAVSGILNHAGDATGNGKKVILYIQDFPLVAGNADAF